MFAIKYRTTPCDRPIANQAKQVGKLAADPHANMKPASLNCASQVTGCYSLLVQCHSFASRATTRTWIALPRLVLMTNNEHNMRTVAQHPVTQFVMPAGLPNN